MAGEIQRSLDFYAGTAADANFTKVYLSGGTAKIPALFKTIEARVGVPVEILNPFKNDRDRQPQVRPRLHHGRGAHGGGGRGAGAAPPGRQAGLNRFEDSRTTHMMIRINLLPVRQVKKREMGRQILVLFARRARRRLRRQLFWYDGPRRRAQTRTRRASPPPSASIAELEKVIGEVNNINTRKKEVEEKLAVLDDLRKGRTGPVRMLDALSTATPEEGLAHRTSRRSAAT